MPKNLPLSNRRRTWTRARKSAVIKGHRLGYNASQQAKYVHALTTLVRRMTDDTKRQIIALFKTSTAKEFHENQKQVAAMDASIASQAKIVTNGLTQKFQALFNSVAPVAATKMVSGASKSSATNLKTSLKKLSGGVTFNTDFNTLGLGDIVKATVTENVALIKSIASQYLSKVQKTVMRSITTGKGLETLIPEIEKFDGISHRQAKNIALDQTRKAYNSINKQRMQKVGVKKFEWVHSGGGQKPREDHIEMGGNIYSFDNLPIIDRKTGERGIPGQAINCRCTMIPVVQFNEG